MDRPLAGLSILILRCNPVAPDPRVEKTAQTLSKAGAKVTVVARNNDRSFPQSEKQGGWDIQRLLIPLGLSRGIANLPGMLLWQVRLLTWLLRHRQFDIIHACDFDTLLPALLLKKFYNKKVVYDIFDLYADTLNRIGGGIRNLLRRWELGAIKQPDAVIIADERRARQLVGSEPRRLSVIYNTPDDVKESLIPEGRPPSSKLHITYVGNLEYRRMLRELLYILKKHPEWSLSLAGFGRDEEFIRQQIAEMPNISWWGIVPYSQALALNFAADVLVALYDPAVPNHRYSSPNKLFEAMMLGIPIIAAENTSMDEIINQEGCGITIPYGDADRFEEALSGIQMHPEEKRMMGKSARRAYEREYNWQRMSERLISIYSTLSAPQEIKNAPQSTIY